MFNYTVAAGQSNTDLDYTGTGALVLNTGTIDQHGLAGGTNIASLTLPATGSDGLAGQNIAIDSGKNRETAVVVSVTGGRGGATIAVAPLSLAHSAGAQVSGSGITLTQITVTALNTPAAPRFATLHQPLILSYSASATMSGAQLCMALP